MGSLREAAWAQTAVVGVRGHGWAAARRPSSPASGNAQAMVDAVRKAFGNTDYARQFTDRVLAMRELQVGI